MKQIGVYLDVSNLYYCIKQKYEGKKLDYAKYLKHIHDLGNVVRATAYGIQMKSEASPFIRSLQKLDVEARYKGPRGDWSVGIVMDILADLEAKRIDTVFIGSSNRDLVPLYTLLNERKVEFVIFASGIPNEVKAICTTIEIPESTLEAEKKGEE